MTAVSKVAGEEPFVFFTEKELNDKTTPLLNKIDKLQQQLLSQTRAYIELNGKVERLQARADEEDQILIKKYRALEKQVEQMEALFKNRESPSSEGEVKERDLELENRQLRFLLKESQKEKHRLATAVVKVLRSAGDMQTTYDPGDDLEGLIVKLNRLSLFIPTIVNDNKVLKFNWDELVEKVKPIFKNAKKTLTVEQQTRLKADKFVQLTSQQRVELRTALAGLDRIADELNSFGGAIKSLERALTKDCPLLSKD